MPCGGGGWPSVVVILWLLSGGGDVAADVPGTPGGVGAVSAGDAGAELAAHGGGDGVGEFVDEGVWADDADVQHWRCGWLCMVDSSGCGYGAVMRWRWAEAGAFFVGLFTVAPAFDYLIHRLHDRPAEWLINFAANALGGAAGVLLATLVRRWHERRAADRQDAG